MHATPYNISAYWRNDTDKGIAVMFQGEGLADIEHQIAVACDEAADPDKRDHSAIMLAQLTEYASRSDELSFDEKIDVACLIGILERIGVIVADNFNGLLIMREVKPTTIPDGNHRTLH